LDEGKTRADLGLFEHVLNCKILVLGEENVQAILVKGAKATTQFGVNIR
jgi:hypothetical protein